MIFIVKDYVKGEVVFQYYKNKELWYKTENGFLFPVPIDDTQDATFLSRDKGIIFMRYIRKHLENISKATEQDCITDVCSKETLQSPYEVEHDR